jgi:hypothetical protein
VLITNDGRSFVYGVFGADGYECDSFEGIFLDEDSAKAFVEKLLRDSEYYPSEMGRHSDALEGEYYGDGRLLEIKQLEFGGGRQPHA